MIIPAALPTAPRVHRGSSSGCRGRQQFQDGSAGALSSSEVTVRDSGDRGNPGPPAHQAAVDSLWGGGGVAAGPLGLTCIKNFPVSPLKSLPNEVMHTMAETERQIERPSLHTLNRVL